MNCKEAHFNRGRHLSIKGRHEEAIEEYRKAIKIDPNYKAAQTNLKLITYLLRKEKKLAELKENIEL